jgi:hypothetical protein
MYNSLHVCIRGTPVEPVNLEILWFLHNLRLGCRSKPPCVTSWSIICALHFYRSLPLALHFRARSLQEIFTFSHNERLLARNKPSISSSRHHFLFKFVGNFRKFCEFHTAKGCWLEIKRSSRSSRSLPRARPLARARTLSRSRSRGIFL